MPQGLQALLSSYNTEMYAIITSLLTRYNKTSYSPKFPKPVISFLIASMFTSAIKKRHDGFKGILGLP